MRRHHLGTFAEFRAEDGRFRRWHAGLGMRPNHQDYQKAVGTGWYQVFQIGHYASNDGTCQPEAGYRRSMYNRSNASLFCTNAARTRRPTQQDAFKSESNIAVPWRIVVMQDIANADAVKLFVNSCSRRASSPGFLTLGVASAASPTPSSDAMPYASGCLATPLSYRAR